MFRFTRLATTTLARQGRALSTATNAAAAATHEPPKKIHGRSGRYAMATYTAASKAGLLEKVEAELTAFSDVVKKNPKIEQFLENPTVPRAEKTQKVGGLLDESHFSHITRNLFLTLSANGRLNEAINVIRGYQELLQAARGSINVTIISAETLKKAQVETIQKAVAKIAGGNKTLEVKLQVEPSILGGLQVLIGDKFLDLSVSSRVNELTKTLDASV